MKQGYRIVSLVAVVVVVLVPLVVGLSLQEDDLVFDDVGEDSSTGSSETSSSSSTIIRQNEESENRGNDHEERWSRDGRRRPLERLWGVPDIVLPAGHVLKLRIPRQAFSAPVDYYEVYDANGGELPRWMYWDDPSSTLMGVPSKKDVGSHHLSVKAIGKHGDTAIDMFVVQVVPEKHEELKHKDGKTHCNEGEEQTLLTILLDAKFDNLSPAVRVNAIENLAGFLGLHVSAFSLHPQTSKETSNFDSSVILGGPGNVKHRKEKHLSSIQWQVGCDGHLWKHQTDLVKRLRDQAKDGTLAEVMQLPVFLWRVKTESNPLLRNRREAGSGDYGDPDDYENYDDEYEDEDEYGGGDEEGDDAEDSQVPPTYMPETNLPRGNSLPEHPHRHHHGEETIGLNAEEIDEHEIVSIINKNVQESTMNSTLADVSSTTTATELTSPPPPPPSTTTTTTTTTTITTTIMPTTSTTSTTSISSTTQDAPTSVLTTSTTATSTTADTTSVTAQSTTASSTESPKSETTEETTEKTKQMETESTTTTTTTPLLPITSPEPNTIPPSVTTIHTSTTGMLSSTTEKMETDSTIDTINVTTEEPTELSAISSTTLPTTIPATLTTLTMTTVTPSTTTISVSTLPPTIPPITNATTSTTTFTTPQIRTSPPTTTSTSTTTTTTTTTTEEPTTTTSSTTTTTTPPMTTTIRTTTENIEYGVRNFPPKQDRRLKKIPVTAGKPLSYIIPANTFSDLEDGDTRKLKLSLLLLGAPLKSTHWLQFNPHTQEIYGLPMENDISTWTYELVAADSEGLNVSDRLDIHVQQHKLSRSVNHEFSIYLRIEKRSEFATDVDWELKVIRSLAELYGDSDTRHITVRSVDIHKPDHTQAIFTWTNDSLPRSSECPKEYINDLLRVLIDKNKEPSQALRDVLSPEIRVKRVVYQGIGQCEDMNRPEVPQVSTQEPRANFPPVPRNQVDLINATVGQLLVFKVPEDTFFDAEDGSSRNMRMSLLTIDRTPIPAHEWLQFDTKNQEFYGVPMRTDVGRKEYQLVVTDREGASATDGLVVVVHPAPHMQHTVEFSMTLDIPYESFAHSALQKRNFIEKLRDLYQDKDTSAISLHSISNGSTVITWHNRTLPTSYCAHEEVGKLRAVLVKSDNDRRSVTDEVLDVMGHKFPVKQITVIPMGICLGELTGVHSPDSYVPPVDDSTSVGAFHDDYLITFVLPAVIIAAMLILAGIIACILYKRRRSGKMSVSEQDDERQSFRNKGIPVIFQDELDEKPDPGNKSPVILKEEKPPLPPPEYQKTEDGADVPMLSKENSEEPYQPPPPFATNRETNRQNRPKPTPTYRKPPPYVPP